jgi:hypothetical protein
MENLSIKSYSAQLRIYSGSTDPPKPKLSDTSSGTSSNPASRWSDLQSPDGDSFTMSLEARIIQISMTHSDDGAPIAGKGVNRMQGNGSQENDSQSGGVFGSGLVKTLMQALGGFLGNDGAKAVDNTNASDPVAISDHRNRYSAQMRHHMGNPEDVASRVLQHLQLEHAERGGSLQVFVDDIHKRMENRRDVNSSKTDGTSSFRIQVDTLITSSLTAWSQAGGTSLQS